MSPSCDTVSNALLQPPEMVSSVFPLSKNSITLSGRDIGLACLNLPWIKPCFIPAYFPLRATALITSAFKIYFKACTKLSSSFRLQTPLFALLYQGPWTGADVLSQQGKGPVGCAPFWAVGLGVRRGDPTSWRVKNSSQGDFLEAVTAGSRLTVTSAVAPQHEF